MPAPLTCYGRRGGSRASADRASGFGGEERRPRRLLHLCYPPFEAGFMAQRRGQTPKRARAISGLPLPRRRRGPPPRRGAAVAPPDQYWKHRACVWKLDAACYGLREVERECLPPESFSTDPGWQTAAAKRSRAKSAPVEPVVTIGPELSQTTTWPPSSVETAAALKQR
ncbi:hypothetical protein HPB50_012284 [Hyalomma asiaticum]|uniref:Uncharacterized protein n=1 Tax=Hyalomma asiaticum TaxID=266040 RepID=A0ACB7S519_HYAAI|nr:hypothetical protein HPB50_012284 [Hyalomma asiaticum]